MLVPSKMNTGNPDEEFLYNVLYGINVDDFSKLRIKTINVEIENSNHFSDKEEFNKYLNLLCYKRGVDICVYFYFNFPKYYELYDKEGYGVSKPRNFKYPYIITVTFTNEDNKLNKTLEYKFAITMYYQGNIITRVINNENLVLLSYGSVVKAIMTQMEFDELNKIREKYENLYFFKH